MKVIYRMTSIQSSNHSPVLYEDKFKLNKLCLKSFREAFVDICPHIHFILDHADKRLDKMIEDTIPWSFEIEHTELGINETMVRSYEIASKYDDYVLFQECDYLYRPVIGAQFLQAIEELKLVSPYDHLNFYQDRSIHSNTCQIEVVMDQHYRTTERNTMTWATTSDIVKENIDRLKYHGYLDVEVWQDLRYAGYPLWVPIPSFATHMVTDYLSPGVDWRSIWQKHLSVS